MITWMKKIVFVGALALAPSVYAMNAQDQVPAQDQAATCSAQMDQDEDLSPVCEARLACQIDGLQNQSCADYCAANPGDFDACVATQSAGAALVARTCFWRGHVRVCVGRDHWRERRCHWRDRWGRCRR